MSENTQAQVAQKSTVAEKLGKVGLVSGAMALTTPVFAAIDTTALETDIASNGASMQTVMLAVLTLVALFVGYRMIKRSMS